LCSWALVKKTLDLHLSLADAMGLVPVKFCPERIAILQYHCCGAFELSPSPWAILLTEAHDVTDATAYRDELNILDFSCSGRMLGHYFSVLP
jgi:hypothetical protein